MFISISRITLIVMIAAGLTGCGASKESQLKTQSYPQDGYMGLTHANPNDPLNATYHHYQDDTNMMKDILAQFPAIQDSRITLRGPVANVKLRLKSGLNDAEVHELRSAAFRALRTNMPRYNIGITIDR
jgi:hypothetical protein